jgi:hypothetical protein
MAENKACLPDGLVIGTPTTVVVVAIGRRRKQWLDLQRKDIENLFGRDYQVRISIHRKNNDQEFAHRQVDWTTHVSLGAVPFATSSAVIASIDYSNLSFSVLSLVVAKPTDLEHVKRGCKSRFNHATVTSSTMQPCSYPGIGSLCSAFGHILKSS